MPSMFRGTQYNEKQIALDYNQYAPQFNALYDCYRECDIMLGDMQHYGIPTRLLDWSVDPLMALFFAVVDNGDKFVLAESEIDLYRRDLPDGCIWIHDSWAWNERVIGHDDCAVSANLLARSLLAYNFSRSTIDAVVSRKYPSIDILGLELSEPIDVISRFSSNRKAAQCGGFTIFGSGIKDLLMSTEFCASTVAIKILSADKANFRKELNRLNMNFFAAYPDKEGFSRVVKSQGSGFNL